MGILTLGAEEPYRVKCLAFESEWRVDTLGRLWPTSCWILNSSSVWLARAECGRRAFSLADLPHGRVGGSACGLIAHLHGEAGSTDAGSGSNVVHLQAHMYAAGERRRGHDGFGSAPSTDTLVRRSRRGARKPQRLRPDVPLLAA